MNFVERSLELRKQLRRFVLGWIKPEILEAEKLREELNAVLKSHWPNDSIQAYELIVEDWKPRENPPQGQTAAPSENFIVFIDPELDVDWINDRKWAGKAEECVSIADSIGARRCQHLPRDQVLEFKRLVGQAVVNGIRGNEIQSCKLAEEAAQFLKDRTVERSRAWTLTSAHWLITISAFVFCASASGTQDPPAGLWLATLGGLVGAYLSLIQKAGSGEWDAASGLRIHILEVLTKLVAGAFFGGVAYAISQSVHAPPSIKAVTPDSYSMFLFGFAAGFFERLIPKMVSEYSETMRSERTETP